MHPEIFKYGQYSFFSLIGICYASVLGPLFFDLWVYVGGGNSNFFYAITLLFSLSQVILISDLMFAAIRREWERLNPGWRRARVDVQYI
jgi:phosphatidylinositol glycan class U